MTMVEAEVEPPELPQVLEDLSEEEAYLFAILEDESGIDLAEFCWFEPDADLTDQIYRAWPFQWQWYRTTDPLQIDQSARSIGKSQSIALRGFAFPFVHPGQEMVVTAPELVHLEPIVSKIEQRVDSTRLSREMMVKGRSGTTHRPFQMNFQNGARIIGRIPQRDGKGVKGIHPIWLELDEAQDYPEAGWKELMETLQRGKEGAVWRAHGVTRGLRDKFYDFTQDSPDNPFSVHRYIAMWRPNWTDQERQEKIQQYGSKDDPDYRRNVLGLHGDATNPLFVLHRLMATTDTDELSAYNQDEFFLRVLKSEELARDDSPEIAQYLDFPMSHRRFLDMGGPGKEGAIYWAGMDVGFTIDPSEIVVFVEYREKPKDPKTKLRLLTRVELWRLAHHQQVEVMMHVIDWYKPRVFAMDKGGNGLPLYQDFQHEVEEHPELKGLAAAVKGYNFSEKHVVEFDDSVEVDNEDDWAEEAGIKRNLKEHGFDVLRDLVDNQRLQLPWDRDLLKQFQGGTWSPNKSVMNHHGKRMFSKGNDHILDACCFMGLGWAQYGIEELLKEPEQQPVYDTFVTM